MSETQWDGTERRQRPREELSELRKEVGELKDTVQDLAKQLEVFLAGHNQIAPKLSELVEILDKGKGAFWLLSRLGMLLVGGWALIIWFKDHIKL